MCLVFNAGGRFFGFRTSRHQMAVIIMHFEPFSRNAPLKNPKLRRADIDKILAELDEPICPYCKRIFSSRGNLRRHMEIHIMSDRKRFECDICLKKYKRKDYLKEHKMTVHSPKNKWKFLRLATNDDYCRDFSMKDAFTNSIPAINDIFPEKSPSTNDGYGIDYSIKDRNK